MNRQTNMNEMKMKEELEQWETHWTFLRTWLAEADKKAYSSKDIVKVMDQLRGDKQ